MKKPGKEDILAKKSVRRTEGTMATTNMVRSPGVNLVMATPRTLASPSILRRRSSSIDHIPSQIQMWSPQVSTPCVTVHFPSPRTSPSMTRNSCGHGSNNAS